MPDAAATPAPASTPPQRGLLKVLGVAFGVAIIVGNTIGSGILRTPGEVAAALPSYWWFIGIWVAGGLYALAGAMTMAELAVIIPRSGGQYIFARRAFGEYPGFVVGWTDWISSCAAASSVAIAFGELGGAQFAGLAPLQGAVAAVVTIAFVALHWLGVRAGDRAQQALSLLKTLAFVAVAVACFLPTGGTQVIAASGVVTAMPAGIALTTALVLSLQSVLYTYDGWNGLVYFGGEVRDPAREIPRAMGWGVVAVIAVYLALNAAYLHTLGIGGLATAKFPASAAVSAVFGESAESIVNAVMAVSLLGALSAIVMQASRVPFAMADDRLMPVRVATVNAGGTPTVALAASGVVTILLIATGTFNTVIAIAAFFFVLQYGISFAAVFTLRLREPDLPRPYRAWGYPWVTGILVLGALAFVVGNFVTDRRDSLHALVVLVASAPIYLLVRQFRTRATS